MISETPKLFKRSSKRIIPPKHESLSLKWGVPGRWGAAGQEMDGGFFEKMVTLIVTFNHLLLQEFNEPFKHGGQKWNRTGPHSAPTREFSD